VSSIDLGYHDERQVEPIDFLRDTNLDAALTGEDRDIGHGLDLVLAIQEWSWLDLDLSASNRRTAAIHGRPPRVAPRSGRRCILGRVSCGPNSPAAPTPTRRHGASAKRRGVEADMKNILVPVDFSEITDSVVATARALAQAFSAKLWLLHVAAPDPDFVGYEAGPQSVRDQLAGRLRAEHRRLQEEAARLRDGGIEAAALLIQGPTVEKILTEADRIGADLIVLGSHGHGAVYRSLLGSVSESVLRKTACPITIVPQGAAATTPA
jgi:nucleotide-binding universal stress UspA family protein